MQKDNLGTRMKLYEGVEAQRRLMPLLPICARLDGKCFSSFTRGLKRPYDERMSRIMVETTRALMVETCALLGYTQSDEISLFWYSDNLKSQVYFDGRIQKMVGDLAAFASLVFNELLVKHLPEKVGKRARFDARVWNVPNLQEAANTFLWRELDATKNSISMAASHYYSHRELQNKHSGDMQEMLHAKGVNWNTYPLFFKRGTFLQRHSVTKPFTVEELECLPEKHEARKNPDLVIKRHVVEVMYMPPFSKVINRVDVLLGASPFTDSEDK